MSDPPKKKRKTSNTTSEDAPPLEYATSLSFTEFSQIHQCLHDPSMPSTINILRFGILKIVNNKFNKRSVVLPGFLGTVGIPDDRETKLSAYAARMRAGGCVSWWNPFDHEEKKKIGKFIGSYTSTLDSLEWNSSTTVSQLGRFPPHKGAERAPINCDGNIKNSSCMAIPNTNDPCFTSKSQGKAIYKVEQDPSGRSSCKGTCGEKITKGELRCCFRKGQYSYNIHPRCLTTDHVPKMNHLEECEGFINLSPENQTMLREKSTSLYSSK